MIQQTTKSLKVGIIGGLGPKTGFVFSESLNNRFSQITKLQPDLLILNLPVPEIIMRKIANGKKADKMRTLLIEAIKRLNNANVDFIVIPCNTVHIFIKELRRISKKPILSIIEECAIECKKRKLKTVGILASTTTIKQKLHATELNKLGIKTITPNSKDQKQISKIIIKIINNKSNRKDKEKIINIIKKLKEQNVEAIILGCTDLQLLVPKKDKNLKIIDTLSILENKTLKELLKSQN